MSRVVMFVRNDATRDSRVLREAQSLTEAGHRVTIVALMPTAGGLPAHEDRDGFDVVRIESPSDWRLVWAWVRYPWRLRGWAVGALKSALRRGPAGLPRVLLVLLAVVASVPMTVVRAPIHALRRRRPASRGILDWVLAWRFGAMGWARDAGRAAPVGDVYHGHDLPGLAAAVAAASRDTGGQVVYDSHEIFLESGTYANLPGWVRGWIGGQERRLAARAVALVTVNPAIGAELEKRLPVKRTVVVHNCPPRWTPPAQPQNLLRAAAGIPADVPILLYHGVFTNHRGLTQLAMASLEPGLERAHVVYLGYGASRPEVDGLAADPRFGGRVHVLDAVEPAVLIDWVAGADVGVIPGQPSTLNHLLSSPNKLFEALAAGVPVAIMDFPYVHRIVLENPGGPLGTVCDPTDPASIARAVREIIERSPDEQAALRRRCLEAAHERWNWESEVARLVDLYAGLSNRGTATSQST
jgi:glycosyltransferase involved in cell wall biosynthesis